MEAGETNSMSTRRRVALAVAAILLAALAYVAWRFFAVTAYPVPPKVEGAPDYAVETSVIVARLAVPTQQLSTALTRDVPETLVTIDERLEECVPSETVKVLGAKLFNTPTLGCDLAGEITRGPISVGGEGPQIVLRMPLSARIEVRNIGDVLKRETATAEAAVTMRGTLGVTQDWSLDPDFDISYDWTLEPGVDFLGTRISLRSVADKELDKMIPEIEATLKAKAREFNLRAEADKAWKDIFTTESVNRENPPVWINIAPEMAGVDQLDIRDGEIGVDVLMAGELSLFVGDKPDKPEPSPLGDNVGAPEFETFDIKVPVLADFKELEPVLLKALRKLAAKGIEIEEFASLDADFQDVTIYATEGDQLAVGVKAAMTPVGAESNRRWNTSQGTVWLTATPVTKPDSELVEITDLEVYGKTNTALGDTLIVVLSSEQVKAVIEQELVEDFKGDYDRIIDKALKGLGDLKVGRLDFAFDVAEVEHGSVQVTGAGLFMPVSAQGKVTATVIPPS